MCLSHGLAAGIPQWFAPSSSSPPQTRRCLRKEARQYVMGGCYPLSGAKELRLAVDAAASQDVMMMVVMMVRAQLLWLLVHAADHLRYRFLAVKFCWFFREWHPMASEDEI
jgi:hypothetical protein